MGTREKRPSRQEGKVLAYMLSRPQSDFYGLEIVKAVKLEAGTVYPILKRFELLGWVEAHWESTTANDAGRPRRRYYRLTPDGNAVAEETIEELRASVRLAGVTA